MKHPEEIEKALDCLLTYMEENQIAMLILPKEGTSISAKVVRFEYVHWDTHHHS